MAPAELVMEEVTPEEWAEAWAPEPDTDAENRVADLWPEWLPDGRIRKCWRISRNF